MKKIQFLFLLALIGNQVQAQSTSSTYAEDTKWVLDKLGSSTSSHIEINDNESETDFSFSDCNLKMKVKAGEGNFNLGIKVSWELSSSNKVSFSKSKEENGYKVNLGVPANYAKVDINLGKKLSIRASPDVDEEDSIIELKNNDKQEVEELVFRLNRIAKNCKSRS